ncbi:hypothetical protein AC578_9020 [Pseudocercospora eumusae]|uniref:Mei2-like C-terminal RNA recognition motif domain-containing protein n=1 Tax=Pseudocercospora eumusae TaxID=321146 RepID=A0A139H2M8_9PEZI|nr:hypothetical protein AC578_9020 [Pseudocercospora eumusae]
MSASTPTPAARKAAAANNDTARMNGGVPVESSSKPMPNGNSKDTKPDWSGPAPVTGTSTGAPFGGSGDVSPTARLNMRLSGHASRFEPTKPSPINFLNRGSTEDDDGQPTIVDGSNTKPMGEKGRGKLTASLPPAPIGTHNGTPSPSIAPVTFTTDTGPQVEWKGGHYIRIQAIAKDTYAECSNVLFNEMHWKNKVTGQKSSGASNSKHLTVYMRFDHVNDAEQAENDVSMVNQAWVVKHVTQTEYAAAQGTGSRNDTSFFDGQLLFVAVFNGNLNEIKTGHVIKTVKNLAAHFGEVLAFNEGIQTTSTEWHFRVEYARISDARKALHEMNRSSTYCFEDWSVTARKLPEPHAVAVAPLDAGFAALTLTPSKHADGTTTSPTGRTAWALDANGKPVAKPAAITVPKVSNPGEPVSAGAVVQLRDYRMESSPLPNSSRYFGSIDANVNRNGSWSGGEIARSRRNGGIGEDNEPQMVNLDRIRDGVDVRTTIMLRNVPNGWNFGDLKKCLDITSAGKYDFSYLRIDFQFNTNVGYAFVNFIDPEDIVDFVNQNVNKEWCPGYHPRKIAQVSYATVQGIDCLIEKFRNSAIMAEFSDYRPKLWHVPADVAAGECTPDAVGQERAFPGPNNFSKQQRSLDNAGTLGLYQPRNRNGNANGERNRRSNYDRGTTHQLQEDAAYQHGPMSPYNDNYAFNAPRAPIGAPPQFIAPPMMPYGYSPMPAGYYNGYPVQYGQNEGFDPVAYGGYPGHGGYPGGYGPMAHYNPAARLRTISRGRLGGRPTNVTIAEHGYSDVDRNARLAANGYVPRSISAAGESGEYFERQAHGSAEGHVSSSNADASRLGTEHS